MKIASWDIGIKNLAYCIIENTDVSNNPYIIHKLDIINIIEDNKCSWCDCSCNIIKTTCSYLGEKKLFCKHHKSYHNVLSSKWENIKQTISECNKNDVCSICQKNAKFTLNNVFYCTAHKTKILKKWDNDIELKKFNSAKVKNTSVIDLKLNLVNKLDNIKELLDVDELDGHEIGSVEWEKRWIAWLFQVVAMLTFLQHTLSFVHNDLHTNNIVWRETDKPFLYYRLKGKTIWRIPTYGKIFSLIDFGRSTFQIGKNQWISDDFLPNEDAAGQYNYGPFLNPKEPVVEPNPSFDLCRLAVSLLSGLFEKPPAKKKGRNVKVLNEEGSWIVYETVSPLYNLLWKWTVDDSGKTVYENRHGEERYEGFDLYIHIAKYVHSAVPQEQLHLHHFQGFVWKQPIPADEHVYCLN
jgi:hypothetical protein